MSLSQYPFNWAANLAQAASNFFIDPNSVKPCAVAAPVRTAIQNVHVWDGLERISNTTIVIEGKTISLSGDTAGAKVINGKGGFLMPGLIDAHVHASNKTALDNLAHYGITTAFDMGSFPSSDMPQWHDVSDKGITSLLFSGGAACAGDWFPCNLPSFPTESKIYSAEDATNFVDTRVREGADYLKILISEANLPAQEYQQIIKDGASAAGKAIVSHAPYYSAQREARAVGGKFITHTPVDQALNPRDVREMLERGQISIPTLHMMAKTINLGHQIGEEAWDYVYVNDSVARMYELGVPILVGTDAAPPGGGLVAYGTSISEEMRLLAAAGMSHEDILRGATSLTAGYFNLTDRGVIRPGMRADLLLLSADPLDDIANADQIVQIWTAGTPVKGDFGL